MSASPPTAGRLGQAAAEVLRALRDAVFPGKCLSCSVLLPPPAHPAPGAAPGALPALSPYFCGDCLCGVVGLEPPLCLRCGVTFQGRTGEDRLCGRCIEAPPAFHMARAAFAYDRALVDVVRSFKYKGKTQLAAPLGGMLADAYRRHWAETPADLVVPVPLHHRRLRERGFNQAFLMLRRWQAGGGPGLPPIETGVLQRVKATAPQAGLGRERRAENADGAFAVRQAGRVAGRHVLLVDDVITTGATAGACAQALLDHGARRVDVLALARVV